MPLANYLILVVHLLVNTPLLMNAVENKTFVDKIIDGLKSAVNEIEDLQVQRALGLAEGRDLFDQIKKKLHTHLADMKQSVSSMLNGENNLKLINEIEFLQVQLNLGLAETKDVFQFQRKRILVALRKLEQSIKDKVNNHEQYAHLHFEIEKFKIKMDLIELQFHLKKITLQYNFEQRKRVFIERLKAIKIRLQEKKSEKGLAKFHEDVAEAFADLKQAII